MLHKNLRQNQENDYPKIANKKLANSGVTLMEG